MTLLLNLRNRNRYERWAPFGCSVRMNPSIPQPLCEIGSLLEATQLVCSVRIQTQAPASRHLTQKASSSSACILQLGKQTPGEEICQKTLSDLLVSWTAGLKWAHPNCLMPPLPTLDSQGCDNPRPFSICFHLFHLLLFYPSLQLHPLSSAPGTALLAAEPSFPALPLEMEGLSTGGGGFPTATCLR